MLKLKKVTLSLFLVVLAFAAFAQGPNPTGAELPPSYKIKGKLIEDGTSIPLEFATISVMNETDSALVTGGITDASGVFNIEVAAGQYFLKIEFIGYQEFYVNGITINKQNPFADLGEISLGADVQTLNEVEVRAEKSQLQMSFDKKVFNVGKDLANTSSSAEQILDNIPSVTVDVEGAVSLRGSEGVRILVNGRPSGLVGLRGSNGLRSIPANLIDRVEIITNPSAKYEAEGMTGIINIILKKDQRRGVNGSVDVSGGLPSQYGGAINLNYRRNKFNLFSNYGINFRKSPGIRNNFQKFYRPDGVSIVDQDGDRERGGVSNSIRFGADYMFSDNDILTGSFLYRYSDNNNTSTTTYNNYEDIFAPANLSSIRVRTEDQDEIEPTLEYALNYNKKFEDKRQSLKATIQFQESTEKASADYLETIANANGEKAAEDILQRTANEEGETSWLFQTDYTHPIGEEGQIEVGYRGSLRNIRNDYVVENFLSEEWMIDPGLTNDFNYDETIHAAYFSLSNKIGAFSYQGGLRYEYSDVVTELLNTGELNDRSYSNFFPSVFLGYELPDQNSIQLSYSRRIRRPRFWYLNPFFSFSDSRNIFRGNPNLDPEYTDAFEVSHIKYWDRITVTSSVYYRYSEGVMQRIQTLIEQNGELITVRQPENLATEDSYGLEFIVSADLYKWLRINGDVNFFRSITDGTNFGEGLSADTYSLSGRINSRMTLWNSFDLQISGSYRAPRLTPQGKRYASGSVDIAASQDILKKKGTLTLSVRDLFNTRIYRFENFGENFESEGTFQWRPRQAILTFNYRINQQKKKGRRGDRNYGGGDDMNF